MQQRELDARRAKYPADQTESYAKAVEILKEKIDTTKFKIFAMRFQEGEELSNDLSSISLDMVNADNYAFRQPTTWTAVWDR